ncbi:MAG: hypothetical protein ABR607_10790 [Pyrinomonadaceae bacterium]
MAHEEKLIEYLSKEIETQTNNLMAFRERINFAVFIGPFVLLGATLYGKGLPRLHLSEMNITARVVVILSFVGVILSYLTMGRACSLIEVHIWTQCNKWRARIAEISHGRDTGFTLKELEFEQKLTRGYWWVYGAMIVAFACTITLVLILQAHI